MQTRSSHNWKTKAGTWDALNVEYIDFEADYPKICSRATQITLSKIVLCHDYKNLQPDCLVSTFVDDYILERFWNKPLLYIERFKQAAIVFSPDFSLLIGMPKPMQMWNVYRNRLVGYIWQKAGLNVVPTISWSDENSFEYCFESVKKGSAVAVSNCGGEKECFDNGFEAMQRAIEPSRIYFQCTKKLQSCYSAQNIVFLQSYFDLKREKKLI